MKKNQFTCPNPNPQITPSSDRVKIWSVPAAICLIFFPSNSGNKVGFNKSFESRVLPSPPEPNKKISPELERIKEKQDPHETCLALISGIIKGGDMEDLIPVPHWP